MKTSYIYIAAVVIAVIVLVIFTNIGNKKTEIPKDIANKEMPNDDVHKGMQNQVTPPSKGNVSEKVVKEMELMKEDLSKTPNDTSKMRMFADFLVTAHKQDEALEYYDKILKKDPKRKDILFSISFVYYNKQDFDKAVEITNKILKMDKNDLQAQYNLGAIAASRGETAKARDIWVRLIQQHPESQMAELAKTNLTQLK